ncbi:BPG_G0016910.mRNA.1.CDS.1 [Saccharomyces cerevisiae]|nr:BPG_G0016910.mRNA.1.CDS.1 [Saccharomyces cerevisiae]CAI7109868.1 BPG_G0016910.mRNA.1.CDS.1 [Saccharomyces cerevisiae]
MSPSTSLCKIDAGNGIEFRKFLKAIKKATDYVLADPVKAWQEYIDFKPQLNNDLSYKAIPKMLRYFSSSLYNVHRDWKKVTGYGKRLAIFATRLRLQLQFNEYLSWPEPEEVSASFEAQRLMAIHQEKCRKGSTFKRLALPA